LKLVGIGSHHTQKRPAKRNRDTIEQEITDFRAAVNNETEEQIKHKKRRTRHWHADEAAIFDDNVVDKSYTEVGVTPSISTDANSHKRDTIVVACADDGTKLRNVYYMQHKPKKYSTKLKNKITGEKTQTLVDKGISGMTTTLWRHWVQNVFTQDPNVNSGDSLDVDHLSSHSDPIATQSLLDKGVSLKLFPKGSAPSLSMCDNSLFKDFKVDFKKKWTGTGNKQEIVEKVWEEFPSSRIVGYWKKCGYNIRHKKTFIHSGPANTTEVQVPNLQANNTQPLINSFFRAS